MYICVRDGIDKTKIIYVTEMLKSNIRSMDELNEKLYKLYMQANEILKDDMSSRYKTYFKKKSNGSLRKIDIPDETLKKFMKDFVRFIDNDLKYVSHNSSYAYIKGKNTKKLVEEHKTFDGDYLVKMDIYNFFGSCTYEVIMKAFTKIYPFCILNSEMLSMVLKTCLYNNVLPQGAPTSPILSDIVMLPVDYYMNCSKTDILYTRYADDIIISKYGTENNYTKYKFIDRAIASLERVFETTELPLNVNLNKCRQYNIKNGIGILGMVYNNQKNISIGHKKKQRLKAIIFSVLMDYKNGIKREKAEIQRIQGIVNYYKYIEPEFVERIISKYEIKTGISFWQSIRSILCS